MISLGRHSRGRILSMASTQQYRAGPTLNTSNTTHNLHAHEQAAAHQHPKKPTPRPERASTPDSEHQSRAQRQHHKAWMTSTNHTALLRHPNSVWVSTAERDSPRIGRGGEGRISKPIAGEQKTGLSPTPASRHTPKAPSGPWSGRSRGGASGRQRGHHRGSGPRRHRH